MKQINIINAYKNLDLLANIPDYHTSEQWALYNLRKELRSHVEFYEEQSNKILEKYKQYADENGVLRGQEYQNYIADVSELNSLDVEIKFEKIKLPFVDGITFKTAESLEDFIEFTQ